MDNNDALETLETVKVNTQTNNCKAINKQLPEPIMSGSVGFCLMYLCRSNTNRNVSM